MAGKRYYWLKLKDDFFSSKRIKKLRKLAGGDTFTIIYLKMQLKAMKTDGVIRWSGLEDNIADELALDLDEEPDNVKVTLQYLLSCGLAETSDDVSFFFPYAIENTESETAAAQRMRDWRARNNVTLPRNNVTQALRDRYGDIDKDKDTEIEQDIDDGFDAFWAAYPRKSGDIKQACFEYLGVIQSGVQKEAILEAVKWQAAEKGQYMPNAEKWLRNKGWTEKKPEPKPQSKNAPASCKFSDEENAKAIAQMMKELDALGDRI